MMGQFIKTTLFRTLQILEMFILQLRVKLDGVMRQIQHSLLNILIGHNFTSNKEERRVSQSFQSHFIIVAQPVQLTVIDSFFHSFIILHIPGVWFWVSVL